MDSLNFRPIGYFHGKAESPSESPRQGVLATEGVGSIVLSEDLDQNALRDLEGFSHIWVLYYFHKNKEWSPMVRPPRGGQKRGVFSTRSPYRPNGIGLSCVRLDSIKDKTLFIKNHDLLDKTPILDIKPYIKYADSFPEAESGWLNECVEYQVEYSDSFLNKLNWLQERMSNSLRDLLENQLKYEPTNNQIKRVKAKETYFIFSYKTWRFHFEVNDNSVILFDLKSGYSEIEMNSVEDPYLDKKMHQEFKANYSDSY